MEHNPQCWANHMGVWAVEPTWLRQAVAAIQSGTWRVRPQAADAVTVEPEAAATAETRNVNDLYRLTDTGVAMVFMAGPMMKGRSKYGGTSTIDTRRAIRAATKARGVESIMLHVDSPGGHAAGTMELAEEVERAAAVKPVHAHIDDLGASAAVWGIAPATRVTVNRAGKVGSIGVFSVVEDWSKAYDEAGVKVHVISTGDYKGAFVEGTEVTEGQIAYLRGLVEHTNDLFLSTVAKGRGLSREQVEASADGRVYPAPEALKRGLVDAVESWDAAMAAIPQRQRRRTQTARARLKLLT